MRYSETRRDGWPLCPVCGEDERWSGFAWDGSDPQPPMQAWIDHGLRCLGCGFDSTPRVSVASISSAIAAAIIQRRLANGGRIVFPEEDS